MIVGGGEVAVEKGSVTAFPRLRWAIIASMLSIISVAGCGIQDIPYYYAPTVSDSGESQNSFRLVHTTSNYDAGSSQQYFLGYELYYRAFESESQAESAVAAVQTEIDRTGSSPQEAFARLEALGFKRFYNADGDPFDDRPLLKIADPSKGAYSTFYLVDDGPWYYTADGADPAVVGNRHYVSRYPSGSSGSRHFWVRSDWLTGDQDYAGTASSPDTLYMVFFGLGLGLDPQTPLTSYPSFPGTPRTGSAGYFVFDLR